MEPLRPAFGYLRVSSIEDDATGSFPAQRRAIEQVAELRGFTVVEWFTDRDLSAWNRKVRRPAYEAMVDRLAEVDAVLFYRLDRLARRIVDFARVHERAQDADCALISATEPIDTASPIGVAAMELLLVFAGLEMRTTSTRLRDYHAELAVEGRFHGGPRPFGFRYDPVTKAVELDQAEAETVRTFARAVIGGMSVSAVAVEAMSGAVAGVPIQGPTAGGLWRQTRVLHLLRQPRIAGHRVHRGEVVAEGAFPAMLDADTWTALQDALDAASAPNRVGRRPGPLTGLLRCPACDLPMTAFGTSGSGKRRYGCHNDHRNGGPCRQPAVLVAEPIEDAVMRQLLDRLGRDDVAEAVDRLRTRPTTVTAKVDARLERLERGYVEGLIPEGRFRKMRAELLAQQDPVVAPPPPVPAPDTLARLDALWGSMEPAERRAVFGPLVKTVRVPGRQGRLWRYDDALVDWAF